MPLPSAFSPSPSPSSSSTPKPTPSFNPSRRQLEELDALLQRMLDLPVNESEEDIAGTLHEPPTETAPPDEEAWPTPSMNWEQSLPPGLSEQDLAPRAEEIGSFDSPKYSAWDTAESELGEAFQQPLFPVDPTPPIPVLPDRDDFNGPLETRAPSISLGSYLLIGLDQVFVSLASGMGRPGRWLRGPAGRSLLGGIGVLCLGAALALVVLGRIGWTW